jgi:hypothetical protein
VPWIAWESGVFRGSAALTAILHFPPFVVALAPPVDTSESFAAVVLI